ncbi:MAG: glycosyltransferase family 9 protein [Gemmatimonadetes bacterium]|nr:glycosyltransferase family 9 protein [Gemmatimonadota bacterium]
MRLPDDLRPARVTVVRPRGLGDVVLSTAVLDALRRAWPDTRIDYIVERPSRTLLESDPRLDRIFLLGGPADEGRIRGGSMWDAIRWLREGAPDIVFDLFSNPRTAIMTAASQARWRVGLDRGARRVSYNVRVPRFRGSPAEDNRYAGDVLLDFLRQAGVRWEGEARANAPGTEADRTRAARLLEDLGYAPGSRWGAVLPGGSWASKRWTVEGFAAGARALAERFGEPTLIVWGPPDPDDAEAIAAAAGDAARLAPPTSLLEMGAMLATPAVVVCTDCLGRHFAVVQGTPTVGVFGSTDPRHWTPRGGLHRTVHAAAEGCAGLDDLPPAPVLRELDRLLDTAPGPP